MDKEQQQATKHRSCSQDGERQARHLVDTGRHAEVDSLSEGTKRMPILQEKYRCPHFDSKGGIDHIFTDLGLPVTFLLTSFYWDNFYLFGMGPKKGADGSHAR